MVEAHIALAERWLDSVPAPASASQIAELEQRYRIRLPDDFRLYLLNIVPADDYMDDDGNIWWPIQRIKSLTEECASIPLDPAGPPIGAEADRYLVFADYLDWCYAWAICCSDGENRGRVALISGPSDCFVADSFSHFVQLVLADSMVIHGAPEGWQPSILPSWMRRLFGLKPRWPDR